jgi:formylglycine-generating enzyme required for sulfatase activity
LCPGDAAPPPALLPVQAAEHDWKPILARAEGPGAELDQVGEDVLNDCQKYNAPAHALRAAQLLRGLPPAVNSLGMKLAPIPPGKFLMGSPDDEAGREAHERPRHEVVLTWPFYIGIHAVTVGQFRAFVNETGYQTEAEASGQGAWVILGDFEPKVDPKANWTAPGFEQAGDQTVVCVSSNDAKAFCDWLSAAFSQLTVGL